MPALAAYVLGDVDGFFDVIEILISSDDDWSAEPVEALQYVKVPWADRTGLLLKLLRRRDVRLALPVLDGLSWLFDVEGQTGPRCRLDDLEWWIEWLVHLDAEGERMPCDRLGRFLAQATDEATQRDIVRWFNEVPRDRTVLAARVLPRMPSVSVDDLSAGAVEWLLSDLRSSDYRSVWEWGDPPLAALATEDFVQRRLIPMLLDGPDEPVRENLLLTLRRVGVRHRRRYVDEDGALIG